MKKLQKLKKANLLLEKEEQINLSVYGRFHFKFLGFNFQELSTGNIYRKGEFWDKFKNLAKITLLLPDAERGEPQAPDGFVRVKYMPLTKREF